MNYGNESRHEKHHLIRLPQVCNVTGLRRSMIYQLESRCMFPKRIKIGVRAVGWLEAEVQAWVESRISRSRTTRSAA